MELRKSAIKNVNQCRFCLSNEESSLSCIYDRTRTAKNTVPLPLQILSCVSVEAFPSDGMPSNICDCCRFFMDIFYRFKQICRSGDESIMQHVQGGEDLQPVPWALKLKRIYQHATRINKKVKTLVSESGATVQVTASNELSGSEDDDDNVYNIKIEGGTDNQDGTCIKVIKTGDELLISKDNLKKDSKESKETGKNVENSFKCKFCDKTFSKSYSYTRHIRQQHKEVRGVARGPFGQMESYRCEECSEEFLSQDKLIYHSAQHATENLTCPLCQEKFERVEQVSEHIKTHVEGSEFMCDLCELVFTTRLKLDEHLARRHADELRQEQEQEIDDEFMPVDEEDDDDDQEEEDEESNMNVTEENGEMIVEITKTDDYMITEDKSADDSNVNTTMSDDSEPEASYLELPAASSPATARLAAPAAAPAKRVPPKKMVPGQTAAILKKAEENKKKASAIESKTETPKSERKIGKITSPVARPAPATPAAAAPAAPATPATPATPVVAAPATADKSLRLLEKELQELQRPSGRSEPAKPEPRARRPQLHTSTPKPRAPEEKKAQVNKTPLVDKKPAEKRAPLTKENKEPKETKGNNNNTKEEKAGKAVSVSPGERVRRSRRQSKVADYAKMVSTQESSDDSDDEEDEEYKEEEAKETKLSERARLRRVTSKPPLKMRSLSPEERSPAGPAPPAAAAPGARKRGRPRKDAKEVLVPAKVRKSENQDESDKEDQTVKEEPKKTPKAATTVAASEVAKEAPTEEENTAKPAQEEKEKGSPPRPRSPPRPAVLVSPTGQALKKVPVRSLPPGVKALPLPKNIRPANQLCEMQIGQKVVKVKKIIMTKAEVESMARKGLVEMKDGTMMLKQGIKLPTSDIAAIKSTLVGGYETPTKPLPSRCDFGDD